MKKVLILCTSPRKGGNSELLADSFLKGAQEAGHQVEKVCLHDKQVGFCKGCLACQKTMRCVIGDDLHLRKLVLTYAQLEGYQCTEAENGFEALEKLRGDSFDLLILDIMMPHMDGFETLGELRRYSHVPVIVLTARGEEYDKLLGFNLGADDYLAKPFSPKELMARIKTVLGRVGSHKDDALCCGELRMEPSSRTAMLGSETLSLTLKEYDLLLALMQNEHIVLSREQLLHMVWGYNYVGDARTVDTHIKTLRERLGERRSMIQTVWGVGYKFEDAA